jgi:hypothetical protein
LLKHWPYLNPGWSKWLQPGGVRKDSNDLNITSK